MNKVRLLQRDRAIYFAIVTITALSLTSCTIFSSDKAQNQTTAPEAELPAPKKLNLDTFQSLTGTPYIVTAVQAEQTDRPFLSSSSYGLPSATNYLFVNTNTLKASRLVPANRWRFLQSEKLGQRRRNGEVSVVQGLWYLVVKTDTNGDKELTERDRKVVALSDEEGKNYTEVISQVDRVLGTHRKGDSILQVFYVSEGKNLVSEVDFLTRKVVRTETLPALE
jgi:hypothetical protein